MGLRRMQIIPARFSKKIRGQLANRRSPDDGGVCKRPAAFLETRFLRETGFSDLVSREAQFFQPGGGNRPAGQFLGKMPGMQAVFPLAPRKERPAIVDHRWETDAAEVFV